MGRKKLPKGEKKERVYIMIPGKEVERGGGKKKVQKIIQEKWDEHIGLIQRSACFVFILPALAKTLAAVIIVTIMFILLLRWEIIANKWRDEFDERDNYK
jgi:hypothetical protein